MNFHPLWSADERYRGALVAFEGFDGSGKTTQIALLQNSLLRRGHDVLAVRQPTDWYRQLPFVREYLATGGGEVSARVAAMLSAADRLMHVRATILPALREGRVVLCDRYVFAALVLFASRGVNPELVVQLNAGIPRPDLALYLDVPAHVARERILARDGETAKFEERSTSVIDEILNRYRQLPCEEVTRIDGSPQAEIVHDLLVRLVDDALVRRRGRNSSVAV